ncbi:MAG: hypothetical protein AAGF77_09825, partial [Bacteroidota bacterium]
DAFYVISVIKRSRVFQLTKLDSSGQYSTITINIEEGEYFQNGEAITKMPEAPSNSEEKDPIVHFALPREMALMRTDVPNTNEDVTRPNKFYLEDDTLILTLDGNEKSTTMVQIDMSNFETATNVISKKLDFPLEGESLKTNSFLFNNILYQMKGNKSGLGLLFFDLKQNKSVPLGYFNRKTPYEPERNLIINEQIRQQHDIPIPEKSNEEDIQKRLRRVMRYRNRVGFQITENDHTLLINCGAYSVTQSSAPMMYGMGGAVGGLAMGIGFSGTYIFEESINLLLEKDGLTLTYNDFKNPYVRMEDYLNEAYEDKAIKKTRWRSKFKIGTDYYLGYLDKKSNQYHFTKFN